MAAEGPPRMHESMILYAQLLEARNRARRWFFINLAIAVIGGPAVAGQLHLGIHQPRGWDLLRDLGRDRVRRLLCRQVRMAVAAVRRRLARPRLLARHSRQAPGHPRALGVYIAQPVQVSGRAGGQEPLGQLPHSSRTRNAIDNELETSACSARSGAGAASSGSGSQGPT
jgi:hypothetical protein